jgi:hypothetical protein
MHSVNIASLHLHQSHHGKTPDNIISDADYGSEENHAFMEDHGIEINFQYNYPFFKRRQLFFINKSVYNMLTIIYICITMTTFFSSLSGNNLDTNNNVLYCFFLYLCKTL